MATALRITFKPRKRSKFRASRSVLDSLSPRERQVLQCRANGMPFKLVADDLEISIYTAKEYAGNAFSKLGVCSSLEAVSLLFKGRQA